MKGNGFIIKYLEGEGKLVLSQKISLFFMKVFNSLSNSMKLTFKKDRLNYFSGLKYSSHDSSENSLKGGMMNIEKANNIYFLLSRVLALKIRGDVVDIGCWKGTSSMIIQETLDQFYSKKNLHVYDSFEGLPKKTKEDGNYLTQSQGVLSTSEDELVRNFSKRKLKVPIVHKGWFKNTLPESLPNKICFAHLDGDLYNSILTSLENIYPHLVKGSVVIIDDYFDEDVHAPRKNTLPGVKSACDKFFRDKREKVLPLFAGYGTQGYFVKI